MARSEDLRINITASDKASGTVRDVRSEVEKIEGEHEAKLSADDQASPTVRELFSRLEVLDKEDRMIVLEATAKQAEREIDRVVKSLKDIQSMSSEEVQLRLEARDRATAKLDAVRGEIQRLQGESVEVDVDADTGPAESSLRGSMGKLTDIGDSLGLNIGSALSAGVVAGVGAAFAASLERALNVDAALAMVEGKFDLSNAEMVRIGQVSADLYAQAWGEFAFAEIADAAGRVQQQLVGTAEISDEAFSQLVASATTLAEVFDQDVNEVIRAAGNLMKNGLVPDAQTAFDVMTRGFQMGGDTAGDLLDTIIEYSQHFAALGISADEAMATFVHGLQNGQRDTDKLADAVKEFGIRAKEDVAPVNKAFEDLGLNAEEMRSAIARGGPTAREAFGQVVQGLLSIKDPVKQAEAAIALFGTQMEDTNIAALESLAQVEVGLGDVEGAASDLGDTVYDSVAVSFETLKRTALGAIDEITTELVPLLEILGSFADVETLTDVLDRVTEIDLGDAANRILAFTENFDLGRKAGRLFGDTFSSIFGSGGEVEAAAGPVSQFHSHVLELTGAQDDAAESAEDLADETEDLSAEHEAAAEAAQEQSDAINDLIDAQRSAQDATFRHRREQLAFKEEVQKVEEAVAAAGGVIDDELRVALDGATIAAADMSDSLVQMETDLAAAEGRTLSAADKTGVWNRSMLEAAAAASGPLRQSILDYTASVNGIPPEKVSQIRALIDQGKIAEAERLLNTTGRNRVAQLLAQANTAEAERALNELARDRISNINPVVRPPGTGGVRHSGGRVEPDTMYQVLPGESFVPDVPGRVMSRADTVEALTGSTPAGPAVVIENYVSQSMVDDQLLVNMLEFAVRSGRL